LRELEDAAALTIRSDIWPSVERSLADAGQNTLPAATSALAAEIGSRVVAKVREYLPRAEALVRRRLGELVDDYERRLGRAIEAVGALAARVLATDFRMPPVRVTIDEPPRFHLRDWDFSGAVLPRRSWFMLRLPRPWALAYARRELDALLERRIRQNLAMVRSGWGSLLDEVARRAAADGRAQIEETAGPIVEALARATASRDQAAGGRTTNGREGASALVELEHLRATLVRREGA
jgi:hypothetical protein